MLFLTSHLLQRLLLFLERRDELQAKQSLPPHCPHCPGPLHAGNYKRKAWGFRHLRPDGTSDGCSIRRWSWCCGKCRKRWTPVSGVFFGRRFYVAPIVLAEAARATGTPLDTSELDLPSPRTVRRWRLWWTQVFVISAAWVALTARLMCDRDRQQLPGALTRYQPTWSLTKLMLAGLDLVRPWTGGCQAM